MGLCYREKKGEINGSKGEGKEEGKIEGKEGLKG